MLGWLTVALVAAVLALAGNAGAATRFHALVVGNNGVFPGGLDEGSSALAPLAYADDDAAAVAALLGEITTSLHLLSVMDATTQALYPKLVPLARAPSAASVEQAVVALAAAIERDRSRGDQSVVWLFFSGHGTSSYRGEPALALSDGALSRDYLYREILARLPATYLHLLVDACHAESIVRPRDSTAEIVGVTPEAANALLVRSTLSGFPHVGAILVSSRDAQAHEWDAIGHGVFTHELLSALRGAADVNGDRLVEYSEVVAFMSAANRGMSDARTRVTVVSRAPELNRRAPLLDLSVFPPSNVSWLSGVSGQRGAVQILDETGRRLLTLHNTPNHSASLLLRPRHTLYVVAQGQEAEFSALPGQVTRFEELRFVPSSTRSRGLRSTALERGLFAVPFGRGYYEGFIDNAPEFLPVPFGRKPEPQRDTGKVRATGDDPPSLSPTLRLSLGLGLSTSMADVLGPSYSARVALGPAKRHGPSLALQGGGSREGPLREWRAFGQVGWLWQTAPSTFRLHAGPRAGAGVIVQQVDGLPTLSTAAGVFGAGAGFSTRLGRQLGLFAELEPAAHLLRLDGKTRLWFAPSGWVGAAWEL